MSSKMIHTALLILVFATSIAIFCFLERTTPGRIGAFAFLLIVTTYGLLTHRHDVIGTAALFFTTFDIFQLLFNSVLPPWIGISALVLVTALFWYILFFRQGTIFFFLTAILTAELSLIVLSTNVEPKIQALLIILPFFVVSQYFFFSRNLSDMSP